VTAGLVPSVCRTVTTSPAVASQQRVAVAVKRDLGLVAHHSPRSRRRGSEGWVARPQVDPGLPAHHA
jgi:hypothetical protein